MSTSPDRAVLIAFVGIVAVGGLNGVAIKFSNAELAPFWGAALRFALASVLLFGFVALRRLALPRGRALLGSVLYGVLSFAAGYALAYWALLTTPAGVAMVILAMVPLLTLLLAVAVGLEKFRLQSAVGALVAAGGIAFIFADRLGSTAPAALAGMLAIVGAAFAIAATNIVVKRFPRPHPVVNNALAMGLGAALLFALSLLAGESLAIPQEAPTLAAVGYLVVIGSAALFMLFLYVLERWTASATSYTLLLMPLVTATAAALLLDEALTPALLVGSGFVLGGVYVGAFAPSLALPLPGLLRRPHPVAAGTVAREEAAPPELVTPSCP
ncbi:MAG: EamA family transporter [Chloroflexota bacterium]|nr:EamA family transporter [Chloroflexota bacterium]